MLLDISTNRGYVLACAVRGPDVRGAGHLKELFTARLRVLLGAAVDCSRDTRPAAKFPRRELRAVVNDVRDASTADVSGLHHYLQHVRQAYEQLDGSEAAILAGAAGYLYMRCPIKYDVAADRLEGYLAKLCAPLLEDNDDDGTNKADGDTDDANTKPFTAAP